MKLDPSRVLTFDERTQILLDEWPLTTGRDASMLSLEVWRIVAIYMGLGIADYVLALGAKMIAFFEKMLEDNDIQLDEYEVGEVRDNIEAIKLCMALAWEGQYKCGDFQWSQVSSLPRQLTIPFGSHCMRIVSGEYFLRFVGKNVEVWPGPATLTSHFNAVYKVIRGEYSYDVGSHEIAIPVPEELKYLANQISEGYKQMKKDRGRFDRSDDHPLLSRVISQKRDFDFKLAKIASQHVIEPFIKGEFQHTL